MSSTNLNYTKGKVTAAERKADLKKKNRILGLFLGLAAFLLAAAVIAYRGNFSW